MKQWIAAIALGTAACGSAGELDGTLKEEAHEDPEALLALVLEGNQAAEQLREAPVRWAGGKFVQAGLLAQGPAGVALEISTSADGETWSEWADAALEDDGTGVHSADHMVPDGAEFFRVRAAGEVLPSYVSVDLLDQDTAASDLAAAE